MTTETNTLTLNPNATTDPAKPEPIVATEPPKVVETPTTTEPPKATETAAETAKATEPVKAPTPKAKAPTAKAKAPTAKPAAKAKANKAKAKTPAAKGKAKTPATKAKAKPKAKAPKKVVPPAKWKPGGQQAKVFHALRRKNGATGDDCNKAYWPDGSKKAGWRIVIAGTPYEWAKRSGCHGYVKREGRKMRLWLRTPAEVTKFGEPDGAKRIFTYKEPATPTAKAA